ncbi:class I SAM-dependent methyltransferase [Acidimicrobium ferrooxidans]|uniref:Class I SAM-dependent methyltransferase n=1 Tax=Acidimicrobium ferrooxidans TaxID=53635 RepID=A0ABS3ANZ0_9ACTN|nr:class I SAM-dependent methyltransferase [Acidimicrobium ferrooxidans]
MTNTENETEKPHDWQEAGDAWGHSAADWACLYEHYALDAILAIFELTAVSQQTRLLDVACGSGLALRLATATGAKAAGIDAASSLIDIARERNPNADIELGSMFDLPWPNDSFNVVISINGIWGGCEAALVEARRVLKPGGKIAISFWGNGTPNDLRGCFKAFARHAPAEHLGSMKTLNNIAAPGVAETMLTDAGFDVFERGSRVSTIEWPDAELAWRAISSVGPAVPALRHTNPSIVKEAVLEALLSCRDRGGIYRFRNDHQFVVAQNRK